MENERRRKPVDERIDELVSSWPGIAPKRGRFGAVSFDLEGSEIGHVHPSVADIDYPKPLREQLLAEGRTEVHHAVPMHPTATTYRIESADDVAHAVWLFRLSYLVHVAALQRDEEATPSLAAIDIEAELEALEPSDAIRRAFDAAVERRDDVRG
ncbi:luciferase family protein [Halosolutus gelatinilyticus]|uniref:luciferase domain-containing protein n=1 Tax=Halosolutus gelatinilyticus TaxID=2931975 RepID=UPI001FF490B2|nr:luciferase family protein [Halosolutus gelatinilyticus]